MGREVCRWLTVLICACGGLPPGGVTFPFGKVTKGNQGLAPGPLREMAEAVSRTDAREPSALRHPQSKPQKWAAPAFQSGIRDK